MSIRTQGNSATIDSREGLVTVTDHGATITITMNHPTTTNADEYLAYESVIGQPFHARLQRLHAVRGA